MKQQKMLNQVNCKNLNQLHYQSQLHHLLFYLHKRPHEGQVRFCHHLLAQAQ